MENISEDQLVERLAQLAQQNKLLTLEMRNLRTKVKYNQFSSNEAGSSEVANPQVKKDSTTDTFGIHKTAKFNMVTVMYADMYGFADILPDVDSDVLIDQLDHLFVKFDEIAKKHSILKIKTIGDSYMCAGGIPD